MGKGLLIGEENQPKSYRQMQKIGMLNFTGFGSDKRHISYRSTSGGANFDIELNDDNEILRITDGSAEQIKDAFGQLIDKDGFKSDLDVQRDFYVGAGRDLAEYNEFGERKPTDESPKVKESKLLVSNSHNISQ